MIIQTPRGPRPVTVESRSPFGGFYAYGLKAWESWYPDSAIIDAEHGRGLNPDVDTALRGGRDGRYMTVPMAALEALLPSLPDYSIDPTPTRDLPQVIALEVEADLAPC